MKRSSQLICGLLMLCLCFRVTGLNVEISVIQSPDIITVNEGKSAEIKCCWTKITKDTFTPKVAWFKNDIRVSAESLMYQNDHVIPSQNCSTLYLRNITPNDKGEYVCEVSQDIPTLHQFRGNKTTLNVATGQQGNNTQTTAGNVGPTVQPSSTIKSQGHEISPLILYLSLAAAAILLTCCLVLVVCRMKKSCKNSERVVIHQTPHSEGEEHENNEEQELSTDSSRGSLQWYQVPVYWSYFDVQSCQDQ